jgi:hypothetical protein
MSPGTYLAKRREVAGLGLPQAAAEIAARGRATSDDVRRMRQRLLEAEEDRRPFSRQQAEHVRSAFAFDIDVYLQLVAIAGAGPAGNLPVPQICKVCGCTWHDACRIGSTACAWSHHDPELCTACLESANGADRGVLHMPPPPAMRFAVPA